VQFTFRWTADGKWEGSDFEVAIAAERREGSE